jgi:hypothetical protein
MKFCSIKKEYHHAITNQDHLGTPRRTRCKVTEASQQEGQQEKRNKEVVGE